MKIKNLAGLMSMTLAVVFSHGLKAEAINTSTKIATPIIEVKRNSRGIRELDMTNEAHYQLVKTRLKLANRSEQDHPQLHQTLEIKKQQQLARQTAQVESLVDPADLDIIENAHLFIGMDVAVSQDDGKAYLIVRAKSSVYGGTEQTYIDLLLEDEYGNQIAPMGGTLSVLDGKDDIAVSQISLGSLKQQRPNLEFVVASSYVETEAADGTINSAIKYTKYLFDWAHIESVYGGAMHTNTLTKQAPKVTKNLDSEYTATSPIDVNNDGVVTVCMNDGDLSCDQKPDQLHQGIDTTDLTVGFRGQLVIPHHIYSLYPTGYIPTGLDVSTDLVVQKQQNPGDTSFQFASLNETSGGKRFSDYVSFQVDAINRQTYISWDIPRSEGRFGNVSLFPNGTDTNWAFYLVVKGDPYFRGRRTSNFVISMTSHDPGGMSNFYQEYLPKIKPVYTDGPADPRPHYIASAPVDNNSDDVVYVCLNRQHSECDYAADQVADPNEITDVNIPFVGEISTGYKITKIHDTDLAVADRPAGLDQMTNIYLQEGKYGGATVQRFKGLDNTTKVFSDYLTLVPDPQNERTVIKWNIPREEGRFGNAKLFSNIEQANWYMAFSVAGFTKWGGGRPKETNFQVVVASEKSPRFGNHYSAVLPKIKLGYSCLAKGTLITMADGSQKSIEQILDGDMVLGALAQNPATAQPMTVVDTSVGVEALEMYRIKAGKLEILMTETHPVATSNNGIVWAKELKVGDRIFTEHGSKLITSVTTEQYQDKVYNLKLAPLAQAEIADGRYLGMFANGLLVGDIATQDEHNYKDQNMRQSSAEILQRLPNKWKTDYISSLEHQG